jgi:uncharacterized protein
VNLHPTLAAKYQDLKSILADMASATIALSGGVDSVLLAKAAYEALGDKALAVTADSPSMPRRELEEARALAKQIGIRHEIFQSQELEDPRYAANPTDRCYFCKSEVFGRIEHLAAELGYQNVCYGENLDDESDHRPGGMAASEHCVRAPLKEARLTKRDIRTLAQAFGLPVWNKPSAACLASRFPYGSQITAQKLAQVEAAEDQLYALGFTQYLRVRHHGNLARIEVAPEDMPKLLEHAAMIVEVLRKLGFNFVTLDLAGYRMGSFNEGLVP